MLNKEKYAKDIVDFSILDVGIALKNNKPVSCCGLDCKECDRNDGTGGCSLDTLLEWANSEYEEPILTEEEKTYLKAVMEPFKDRVNHLRKYIHLGHGTEYVEFVIDDHTMSIDLPDFESGTKYKGMELGREYTLEELGL